MRKKVLENLIGMQQIILFFSPHSTTKGHKTIKENGEDETYKNQLFISFTAYCFSLISKSLLFCSGLFRWQGGERRMEKVEAKKRIRKWYSKRGWNQNNENEKLPKS